MRQMYYSKRYTELTRGGLSWMLWCVPWNPSSGLRHSFLQLLGKCCLLVAWLSLESLPKNCPWLKEATSPKVIPLAGQPGSSWREGPKARPPCLSWRHLWRVFPASEFRPPHHSWNSPSILLFPLLCHGAVRESTPQQSPAHKTSSPSLLPRKPNLQSWWLDILEAGSAGFFVDTNHCILERQREAEGGECWKTAEKSQKYPPASLLKVGSLGQQQQEEWSQAFPRPRHFPSLSTFLIEPEARGSYSSLFWADYSAFCGILERSPVKQSAKALTTSRNGNKSAPSTLL